VALPHVLSLSPQIINPGYGTGLVIWVLKYKCQHFNGAPCFIFKKHSLTKAIKYKYVYACDEYPLPQTHPFKPLYAKYIL
jgi:hypothetical protein